MTTVEPNPHSPYADADPTKRHIFPTVVFFGPPRPGALAPTGCQRMAVVPEETLRDANTGDNPLPDGLCPACLAAMRGKELPEDVRPVSRCRECGCSTDHDGLCALCRVVRHEAWWPTRRANTPDRIITNADGTKSTELTVKRGCNGCGQYVGDADNRDVDDDGNLTDVRGECRHCWPLVELEAAGCRTWHVLPRDVARIDDDIDRYGVYAKGYFEWVDGKTQVTGLRVGTGPDRVVAKFGDWLVRHPDGPFTVHKAPTS